MNAILLGGIAAIPSYFALIIRAKTSLDDSLDVVAAHGVGGTVGALLTGVFAEKASTGWPTALLFGNPGQLVIQATAVGAAIVYSGVMSFILLKVIGLVCRCARPTTTKARASTSRCTAKKRTSTPRVRLAVSIRGRASRRCHVVLGRVSHGLAPCPCARFRLHFHSDDDAELRRPARPRAREPPRARDGRSDHHARRPSRGRAVDARGAARVQRGRARVRRRPRCAASSTSSSC